MNIQDIFYHGIRDQVRRVLGAKAKVQAERSKTSGKRFRVIQKRYYDPATQPQPSSKGVRRSRYA